MSIEQLDNAIARIKKDLDQMSELVPVIPQSMVQSFRKTKHAKDLAAKMHPERSPKNKRRIAASSDDGGEKE